MGEGKHFFNPNANHTINAVDKFENLTTEVYKDGNKAPDDGGHTDIEQRGLVNFLKQHPNIKAYFHGNTHINSFYVYHGPDNDISLPVFNVDSPMKGRFSAKDETRLSFQLISIDTDKLAMTVRECLWDTQPLQPSAAIVIGSTKTISLKVH